MVLIIRNMNNISLFSTEIPIETNFALVSIGITVYEISSDLVIALQLQNATINIVKGNSQLVCYLISCIESIRCDSKMHQGKSFSL